MALRGVRSSWLMFARNCDLCWLASASCLLLSWISSNIRTFSIAIAAWSAKVDTSSICLSVNGCTCKHVADHFDEFRREPVGLGAIKHAILLARDRRLVGVAKPRRRFDQRLQNS